MTSIDELSILREHEDHIEFKRAKTDYPFSGGQKSDPKDRRHCVLGYVVALANEGGGRLVLGMEDHYPHQVSGTEFALNKLGTLEDEIYTRLRIRVSTKELFDSDSRRVVVIEVPSRPVGKTLRFEGVPLMRVGESLREMDDAEYFRIVSEADSDYSAHICEGLTIDDLDPDAVREMRSLMATKQVRHDFENIPLCQLLTDLRLISGSKLTVAALLLLGSTDAIKRNLPQWNVVVEYRLNHSQTRYSARAEFCGPLFTIVNDIWNYINQPASNPLRQVENLPQIIDIPSLNRETIREALINALIHRSLQMGGDVLVSQYPDGIVVTNPGGFPYGVNIGNILTVTSSPRSRLMAEVIEKAGLVERSGQGVDIMFANCISEGKVLPDYSQSDDYQVVLKLSSEICNPALFLYIKDYQSGTDSMSRLNVFDLLSLYFVRNHQVEYCREESVARLLRFGLIRRDSFFRYVLGDGYYKSLSFVKSGDFQAGDINRIVCSFHGKEKVQMSSFVEGFDSILTQKQVRTLIQKCHDNGILSKEGSGRYTFYRLGPELSKLS